MEFYPDLNEQSASRRYSLTRQANTLPERVMGGDGGGGAVSRWAYFCIQPSSIFCLMYSPICLLYHFIQDFAQKALLSEIQTIRRGGVTMYDKG